MATSFFIDHPLLSYSLDDFKSEQVITDIFRRIVLSDEYKQNSSYLQEYFVLHGEKPEEVSYRFYGTTKLHWVVLLTNEIVDPRFEWPTSEENLKKVTEEKYGGEDSIFTVRNALNSKGRRVETFFLLAENSSHEDPIRIMFETNEQNFTKQPILWLEDPPNTFRYETNFDVEVSRNETNRTIKVLKPSVVTELLTKYRDLINT